MRTLALSIALLALGFGSGTRGDDAASRPSLPTELRFRCQCGVNLGSAGQDPGGLGQNAPVFLTAEGPGRRRLRPSHPDQPIHRRLSRHQVCVRVRAMSG